MQYVWAQYKSYGYSLEYQREIQLGIHSFSM